MPADTSRAVFLSYASQDAEAARCICEALRSGGVEVWFDADGGLEHGDEWDAKIRRQIKECVLFIPVISANTQAREEGYFRIEWDLAAERARGIASGVPFILPFGIDDTREADALVPDRFRAVQWTRLQGGEVPSDVRARLLKLWSHRTGVLKHESAAAEPTQPPRTTEPAPQNRADLPVGSSRRGRPGWILGAAGVIALLGVLGWKLFERPAVPAPPSATSTTGRILPGDSRPASGHQAPGISAPPAESMPSPAPPPFTPAPAAPLSPARALAAKGRTLFEKVNSDRPDHELAEEFYKQAIAADALDGDILAGYSQLCASFVYRGFDRSPERREQVRVTAERALRLAPASIEARLAIVGYYWQQRINISEIEQTLREIRRLRSGDHRTLRFLSLVLRTTGKFDEGMVLLDESAAAPGGDPVALADKAGALLARGRNDEAARAIEASIAQQPLDSALLFKVYVDLYVRGDREAALKTYTDLPQNVRISDRGIYYGTLVYLWNRQPAKALALLRGVTRDYLIDGIFSGPRGALTGRVHFMQGNAEAAAVEWRTALEVVEKRFAKSTNSSELLLWRATLLAQLGQTPAAESALRTYEQMVGFSANAGPAMPQEIMDIYIALGRHREVMDRLEASAQRAANPARYRKVLTEDPRFDALRGNSRFDALLEAPRK